MSKLFRKVSWPYNVERYDRLRKDARKLGLSLTVKNGGTRTIPHFVYYIKPGQRLLVDYFSDLDAVEAYLQGLGR